MISRFSKAAFSNAYLLLTLAALFWGGNYVLGKGVAGHFPPIALSWFRWTLACLILLPFVHRELRRDWPVIKKNLPIMIGLGIMSVATFNTFSYIGLNETTAINGFLLQSSGPVTIAAFAFMIFGDRITLLQIMGIIVSLAGVCIGIARGDFAVLMNLKLNTGDLWIFAAVVIWSLYTVYLRKKPDIHWKSFAAATFFIGAVAVTPFAIWEYASGERVTFDTASLLSIGYVAIFPSILSYVFFNRGVELIGANRSGPFLHLVPFFGIIMAIFLLGENLQYFHIAGFALILLGVYLASRKDMAETSNASK